MMMKLRQAYPQQQKVKNSIEEVEFWKQKACELQLALSVLNEKGYSFESRQYAREVHSHYLQEVTNKLNKNERVVE